jgi:hypothetical protein
MCNTISDPAIRLLDRRRPCMGSSPPGSTSENVPPAKAPHHETTAERVVRGVHGPRPRGVSELRQGRFRRTLGCRGDRGDRHRRERGHRSELGDIPLTRDTASSGGHPKFLAGLPRVGEQATRSRGRRRPCIAQSLRLHPDALERGNIPLPFATLRLRRLEVRDLNVIERILSDDRVGSHVVRLVLRRP